MQVNKRAREASRKDYLRDYRPEVKRRKEQGADYAGPVKQKKGDFVYRAMVHLPRWEHHVENLRALCDHPEFAEFKAGFEQQLQDKAESKKIRDRLIYGIREKGGIRSSRE